MGELSNIDKQYFKRELLDSLFFVEIVMHSYCQFIAYSICQNRDGGFPNLAECFKFCKQKGLIFRAYTWYIIKY